MDILQDPDMVPFPYESLALPPSGQIGMTPMAGEHSKPIMLWPDG